MGDNSLKDLNDDNLQDVAGGYIFYSGVLADIPDDCPWEVIDDRGDVVARESTPHAARSIAAEMGFSGEELTWDQLQRLRETGNPF